MSLYILMEKDPYYFIETRTKQEIASVKSLNQKRIPTIVFNDIKEIPEIFSDPKAVLLITHEINERNEEYVKLCNENDIPVISLHDKTQLHHKYVYSAVTDNDDITASMVYRYFKCNGKEKIAFFGFYANAKSDCMKVNAYNKVSPNFSAEDIFYIDKGFEQCLKDFLARSHEYDGVYFPNDIVAIAFLDYFKKVDPDYLKDRFFLGFSDIVMSKLYHIRLSSISYTVEAVKSAVVQIYRCLTNNKNDFDCLSIDLKNVLQPRESTENKAATNADWFSIQCRTSKPSLQFKSAERFDHKSDPALKEIFALENLFLNTKTMDLLIIYMFAKGYSNSTITHKLFLTPQSLSSHKNNYFRKTGCKDKAEFVKLLSKYVSLKHLEEFIQSSSSNIIDFSNY